MIDLEKPFSERLNKLTKLFKGHEQWFRIPYQTMVQTLTHADRFANMYVKEGYEGAMLKAPDHMYQPGKRVNNIIKIKPRLTADLLCVGIKDGAGKYEGMIGSLILEDSEGRIVAAGSGLSDWGRSCKAEKFIGQVVEIEYERIDETYVQPIIKGIRDDKDATEID
jgi:DNA ligase-1